MIRGEVEQAFGFEESLTRLHGNDSVDSGGARNALQICRQEIAPDRSHVVVDPAVFDRIILPKMMMGIDLHFGVTLRWVRASQSGRRVAGRSRRREESPPR